MGKIRQQREEALRKKVEGTPEIYEALKKEAHDWTEDIFKNTHRVNNSPFKPEQIEQALATTLSFMEEFFDKAKFPTPVEEQRVYDISLGTLQSMVHTLIRDGMPGFTRCLAEATRDDDKNSDSEILTLITQGMACTFAGELDRIERLQPRNLAQDREERDLSREYNSRLAHSWVSAMAERMADKPEFAEALKKMATHDKKPSSAMTSEAEKIRHYLNRLVQATYKGLNKTESAVMSFPCSEYDRQKMLENSMEKVQDHLILLMFQGPSPFISSYRNLRQKENDNTSAAAADGIRVMARELGIETSISGEIRRRRMINPPESGFRESRR